MFFIALTFLSAFAIEALGTVREPRAAAPLGRLVADRDLPPETRLAAARALGSVTESGLVDTAVALAAHIDQTTLRHRQQPDLDAAVAGARRRVVGDLWAFGRRGSFADISPLVAVALASWGHSQTAGREPSIIDIWSLDDEDDA